MVPDGAVSWMAVPSGPTTAVDQVVSDGLQEFADAACCAALGRRSRAQDHRAAADLLRQIAPAGDLAAAKLERLVDLKDTAQYGVIYVSAADLRTAMRLAKGLVEFAAGVVSRR